MKVQRSMRLDPDVDDAIMRESSITGKAYSEIIENSLTTFFQLRDTPRKPYHAWVAQINEASSALREMGFSVSVDIEFAEVRISPTAPNADTESSSPDAKK